MKEENNMLQQVMTKPGEIIFREVPVPEVKDDQVLVKIMNIGICGSDIHYWVNGEPKGLVMGHEFCGRVVDPGDRLDLQVGDRVTALPISR